MHLGTFEELVGRDERPHTQQGGDTMDGVDHALRPARRVSGTGGHTLYDNIRWMSILLARAKPVASR